MIDSPRFVYGLSFILAFCSLTYELVFAQVLSVCLGGTKYQYLLTISLFTCALGAGSLYFGVLKKRVPTKVLFFNVEIFLTFLGLTGPFIITWLLRISDGPVFYEHLSKAVSYLFIFLIGFFSGFELPCLFSLAENKEGKILAFDYMGMLGASLFFPLIGLPLLGTAGTALATSNINLMAIVLIRPSQSVLVKNLLLLLNLFIFGLILFFREELNHLLSSIYLMGVK